MIDKDKILREPFIITRDENSDKIKKIIIPSSLQVGSDFIPSDIISSGYIISNQGFSGSLTQLSSGDSYIEAGTDITVTTGSNGQIIIASTGVSDFMTNGVNNYVVTATGTDAINAEANMTFDGTDLVIAGGGKVALRDNGGEYVYSVADGTLGLAAGSEIDLTATTIDINGKVDIDAASGAVLELGRNTGSPNMASTDTYLIMDSNGGSAGLNWYADDDVILANGGGNVGVGLTSPASMLHVKQTSDMTYIGTTITNNGSALRIEDDDGDAWVIGAGSNDNLWFGWTTTASSSTSTAQGYMSKSSNAWTAMNFTGQHRSKPETGIAEDYVNNSGLIVIATGNYSNPVSSSLDITINDATPTIELSSMQNDKRAFGIISMVEDVSDGAREFSLGNFVSIRKTDGDSNRLFINSLGEGAIWICNINGDFENGDYITTCEIPGYGMKQDDDLLHNYTVAKITMDCDFNLESDYQCVEFEYDGNTYKKAFVGCTYHCG